jgi:hypothetical protein
MTEHLVHAIRSSSAARSGCVRQMRHNTRSALAQQRAARQALTRSVRRGLHDHRAAVIGSLRTLLTPAAGAQAGAALDTPPAPRVLGELDPAAAVLNVFQVVERHPEGVRAADIGNELGVDWRRVLSLMRHLLDAGMVERVDQQFYAAGKASPRW